MLFRRHCTGFFPVECCLESLGQHWTGFLVVQYCPKSITTLLNRIFSCEMLSGASCGQHCTGFLPVQYCPKSIKTTLNKIFSVQCCLEPLGEHGARLF